MSNREEIIRRGESAQHLLNNPTALAALDAIAESCKDAWACSKPEATILRDDAYQMMRCIQLLRTQLEIWRDDATAEIKIFEQRQRDAHVMN